MPTSEKRIAANRANAQKSTGPRTPEGKARSAQNAVKHGFTATHFTVVRLEELDEVARLKADLVATYRPVNAEELFALERAAIAQQGMLRAARFEAGYFTACLNDSISANGTTFFPMSATMVEGRDGDQIPTTQAHNRNYALATGFNNLFSRHRSFTSFLRYQAQTERLYRRAIEDFDRLKSQRDELPNEPIPVEELPVIQPVAAPETNPTPPPVEPIAPPPNPASPPDFTPGSLPAAPVALLPAPEPTANPPQEPVIPAEEPGRE